MKLSLIKNLDTLDLVCSENGHSEVMLLLDKNLAEEKRSA